MINDTENPNHFDDDEFLDRQSSLSDVSLSDNHGPDSPSASQPEKKKVRIEAEASSLNVGAFSSMAGDPNMLALGSMAVRPHPALNQNQNFSLANGTGLPMNLASQPMLGMGFSGTSPGFHTMGQHLNHLYGYGPGFAMSHNPPANSGVGTPNTNHSSFKNKDDSEAGGDHRLKPDKSLSGMTPPLMFAAPAGGILANNQMVARAPGPDGNYPAVMQVVSTDSHNDNGGRPTTHLTMVRVPMGGVITLQQPKKWVRWSDHEDLLLCKAVEQFGENNYKLISEQVFHGSRSEGQCKNRWKKALQPGLVKGRWTREEDNIITESVEAGNMRWSDIAKHLPGRIGEQIKERWVNVLDPDVRKGVWTEAEMQILRAAQSELGNKWSEIAKRISGRSENSVKNRWYNQKTSDKRAAKKSSFQQHMHHQQSTPSHRDGPMMRIPPQLEQSQLYEHEEYENPDSPELGEYVKREQV